MRLAVATLALIVLLAYLAFAVPRIAGAESSRPQSESLIEGKPIGFWHARTVINRREANQQRRNSEARGRTIRKLQGVVRGSLAMPTGHWLDGAFLCLHRFEGSWQDDGAPYYGGIQMDRQFVRSHAPAWVVRAFGSNPARWPAAVQITVGINAWTTRGFGPWPTTRHYCGL